MGILSRWSHRRFSDLLSPYIDSRLEEAQVVQLERHIAACPRCQQELQTLRDTVALLRALPHAIPTRSFVLTERPEAQDTPRATPAYLWGMRAATAMASVALMVLLLGDLSGTFSRDIVTDSEPSSQGVEERDADLAPTSPGADEESTSSSLAAEEAASPIEGAAPSDSPPPQAGAEREAALPADAKDDLSTAPEVEGDAASVGTALLAAQTQEEEVLPLKAMEVVLGVLLVLLALVTLFATWRLRQRGRPA